MAETDDRIAALRALVQLRLMKTGWDGYKAPPISPIALERAQRFLDTCSVVPCSDGGVQLEWHAQGIDLEIEFRPNGKVELLAALDAEGREKGEHGD